MLVGGKLGFLDLQTVFIHGRVLALFPQTALRFDIGDAVLVDTMCDVALDRVRIGTLDDSLSGLCAVLIFALEQPSFEVGCVPGVFLLVGCEELLESCGVLGCFVPYLTERYFEEQDAVVVFLNEVSQFRILLLEVFVGIGFDFFVGHLCRQVILGAGLTNKTLIGFFGTLVALYLALYLAADRVEGLDAALTFFVQDMPTVHGLEGCTDLTYLECESSIFEGLHHHTFAEPSEVSATGTAAAVVGLSLGYLREVLCGNDCGDRVDECFLGCYDRVAFATRGHLHDMAGFHFFVVAFFFNEYDMEAVLGAEGCADFTKFGVIDSLFERIDITERSDPSEFAAGLLYRGVGADSTGYIGEGFYFLAYFLCLASFAFDDLFADGDTLIGFVDLRECFGCLCTVCGCRALDSDVCGAAVFGHMAPTHLHEAVHGLVVLQVLRRSLSTVAFEFFLEGLGGVDALRFGFYDLEFEVNEHVEVLVHGLGIECSGLVVFLIDVEELLCTDGLAVDGHQRFVLSHHVQAQCCYDK